MTTKLELRLDDLPFDNRFTAELPADPSAENTTRFVANAAYSRVTPRTASAPKLIAWSAEMLDALDLSPRVVEEPQFTEVFVGNRQLSGMDPHAARYGGHQFGHWADQLGDGRAIVLGEVVDFRGARHTLQLKGAGPTPYSRRADGLAVLRSSVREFLCSEAMHHLGVPTTRALSLITTGDEVMRDMFYDGNPKLEPGAVVCRVAPSFLRFGNYELPAAHGELDLLRSLVEHTLRTHFPHHFESGQLTEDGIIGWFGEVVDRTADMIVEWQRVGFVHGVMNTDNMSVHGLTIDYGPYGWLDNYDPSWTPNTTDAEMRRYAFGQQPKIGQWNLAKFGNALVPLIRQGADRKGMQRLQDALNGYGQRFDNRWNAMMAGKLGLQSFDADHDPQLIGDLLSLLERAETDMTLFFRGLTEWTPASTTDSTAIPTEVAPSYYRPDQLDQEYERALARWLQRYARRLESDAAPEARQRIMNRLNPRFVLRNYLAQLAIDAATEGDHSVCRELLDTMRRPYDDQPERARFAAKRPDWARTRAGCSQLSCSS